MGFWGTICSTLNTLPVLSVNNHNRNRNHNLNRNHNNNHHANDDDQPQ